MNIFGSIFVSKGTISARVFFWGIVIGRKWSRQIFDVIGDAGDFLFFGFFFLAILREYVFVEFLRILAYRGEKSK